MSPFYFDMIYTKKNIITGALIYAIGDTIATLILNDFSWVRLLGMAFIGATVYAFEIPNVYKWIDNRTEAFKNPKKWLSKTLWATVYFNPLWIARHMLFIFIITSAWDKINWGLIAIGFWSFVWSLPITFAGNYVIQNLIKFKYRFLASSVFSGLMAIYYALSEVYLN